jgi:hypothetical protein
MQKETIEQAADSHELDNYNIYDNVYCRESFIEGANWQQERSYSEKEILEIFDIFKMCLPFHYEFLVKERFKKH